MKQYDSYKGSGVEWIGEVPSHWTPCRFKDFMKLSTTASDSIHKIGLENIESATGRFIETNTEFEGNGVEFKKDSIVYGKLRPYLQKVWLADLDGNAVGDFFVFNANSNSYPLYLKYLMLSDGFTKEADGSTFGAKMPRVSSDFILTLHFCLPPLTEQTAIANYLDKKCSEIDNVISAQQNRIALLQELKQSVITHAVTKGLDSNVEMKDSGVEWIGEVPTCWNVMPIKHVAKTNSGSTPKNIKGKSNDESIIKWVRTTDLSDMADYVYDSSEYLSKAEFGSASCPWLPKHTVVVAMYGGAGTIGKTGILGIDATINQALCSLETTSIEHYKYLFYTVKALRPYWMKLAASSRKDPNISQDIIRNMKVVVPSYIEQEDIVDYLDRRCSSLDNSISKAQHQVDLLQEYKQSLITEVVTGKRKVC